MTMIVLNVSISHRSISKHLWSCWQFFFVVVEDFRLSLHSPLDFYMSQTTKPLNKNMIKHQFTSTICKRISVSTENYIRHKNPFQARFPWHLKWSNETVPFKIDRSYTRAYVGRDSLKIFFSGIGINTLQSSSMNFYFRFARVFQHDINCQLRWKENVREKLIIKKKGFWYMFETSTILFDY